MPMPSAAEVAIACHQPAAPRSSLRRDRRRKPAQLHESCGAIQEEMVRVPGARSWNRQGLWCLPASMPRNGDTEILTEAQIQDVM